MRTRSIIVMTLALAFAGVATAAAEPESVSRTPRGRMEAPAPEVPFGMSGEFTGALSGAVVLGGARFPLASTVSIYEIGRGTLPVGALVTSRMIHVTGTIRRGVAVVDQIIVRPAAVPGVVRADPAGSVRAESEPRPQ